MKLFFWLVVCVRRQMNQSVCALCLSGLVLCSWGGCLCSRSTDVAAFCFWGGWCCMGLCTLWFRALWPPSTVECDHVWNTWRHNQRRTRWKGWSLELYSVWVRLTHRRCGSTRWLVYLDEVNGVLTEEREDLCWGGWCLNMLAWLSVIDASHCIISKGMRTLDQGSSWLRPWWSHEHVLEDLLHRQLCRTGAHTKELPIEEHMKHWVIVSRCQQRRAETLQCRDARAACVLEGTVQIEEVAHSVAPRSAEEMDELCR